MLIVMYFDEVLNKKKKEKKYNPYMARLVNG